VRHNGRNKERESYSYDRVNPHRVEIIAGISEFIDISVPFIFGYNCCGENDRTLVGALARMPQCRSAGETRIALRFWSDARKRVSGHTLNRREAAFEVKVFPC
jgi:hypothetical protein